VINYAQKFGGFNTHFLNWGKCTAPKKNKTKNEEIFEVSIVEFF
jgi:hypothetical protein